MKAFHGRVNAWEIWNEEPSPSWWTGSIAQYAGLVKAAYPAIKSADPKATVVARRQQPTSGSTTLYADGIKGYFDADAIHTDTACNVTSPYVYEYNRDTTTVNQYFFLGFTGTHSIMAAHGDGAKAIYMTELGWSSTSAECTTGALGGPEAGGRHRADAGDLPHAGLSLPGAAAVLLRQGRDVVRALQRRQLDRTAGQLRPARHDLRSPSPRSTRSSTVSLHGDQQSGPCGNFSPPRITILHPTPHTHFSGPLKIAVAASSPANGVREITIYLTRRSREHFGAKGFPATLHASLTWLGARNLHAGRHKIKVVVIDKLGNVATKTFYVVHTASRSHARHTAAHH